MSGHLLMAHVRELEAEAALQRFGEDLDREVALLVHVPRRLPHERHRVGRHALRHHERLLLAVELVRDVGKRARVEVRALQQVIQAVLTAQRGLLLLMVQDRHDAHA